MNWRVVLAPSLLFFTILSFIAFFSIVLFFKITNPFGRAKTFVGGLIGLSLAPILSISIFFFEKILEEKKSNFSFIKNLEFL